MKRFALAIVLLLCPAHAEGVAPVDAAQCAAMKAHHVLNADAPVGCNRLATVTFDYLGFDGALHHDGRIVVMDAVAPSVLRIFQELRQRNFPIAKAQPVEAYDGDDEASMADDNTSAFNDRTVPGGDRISLHAYGAAIDINPVENPFMPRNDTGYAVHPPAGVAFVNRRAHRPGKPDRKGFAESVVDVFAANGFVMWGGDWDDPIDYQHFDIGRDLAVALAGLPPAQARQRFKAVIAARSGQ